MIVYRTGAPAMDNPFSDLSPLYWEVTFDTGERLYPWKSFLYWSLQLVEIR